MFFRTLWLLLTLALAPTSAFADCAQGIDALDRRLKTSPPDDRQLRVVTETRQRAVDLCMAGQEAAAMHTLQVLEGMLSAPVTGATQQRDLPHGRAPNDSDLTRGSQSEARDARNPWDALSDGAICDWLPADEIEDALRLAVKLETEAGSRRCDYRFPMPNGYSATAFIFHVEPHDDPDYPRKAETRMSTGFIGAQFERFDPGTPLLRGYDSVRAPYIYVYPQNGITVWKLNFLRDSPEKDVMFGSAPQPANLGKAFLSLLIDRHRERFETAFE